MSDGTAMTSASPFPDVDIPDVGVFDYLFGDIDEADLERVAMVDATVTTINVLFTITAMREQADKAAAAKGLPAIGPNPGRSASSASAVASSPRCSIKQRRTAAPSSRATAARR
jgi:hypothetical protein